jgi:hypothetical protein
MNHQNPDIAEQVVLTLSDMINHEYEDYQHEFIGQLIHSTIITDLLDKTQLRRPVLEIVDALCEYESIEMYESPIVEKVFDILNNSPTDVDLLYSTIFKLVDLNVEVFCRQYVSEMEILLITLSRNKNSPSEVLDDIVDTIRLCVTNSKGYDNFLKYDGFELILLIMKHGNWGFKTFLKLGSQVLDSLNERRNVDLSLQLVRSDGFLRSVFKYLDSNPKQVLKLLVSLMVFLPFGSDERVRVINKIMSKNAKQLRALLKLGEQYAKSIKQVGGYEFDDLYLEKIEAGLDVLQLLCTLEAWLLIEDEEFQHELIALGIQMHQVVEVLKGYRHELEFNYDNCEAALREETAEHLNMLKELLSSMDQ